MQIKPHRIRTKTAVVLAFCCGLIAACAHERPLVVPTTPPSERNENPGLDRPAGGREKSSALGRGCSSAEDCFNAALQNAEDGDRTNAAAVLKSLRERYPDTPWAKRAGFLLGLWAAEDASPDADALLSKAMKDFPPLEEYGLFFMAGGQAKRGEFRVAVETYDRLLRKFPESALAAQAQYQKGAALFLAGDCPSALTEWNAFLVRFPKDENAAKALLQQADCAVKLQDSARAVRELLQVWFFYADSPEATEARKNLERLGASGVKIPGPTIEARTQRGRTLFDAARYAEAADEFKAVLAAGEPANRDEIESKLSEALIQLKQYDEARQLLTGLAARTGHPDILTNAMFWLGRLAIRQGEEARVLQIERQLADRFPSSPERAKLLFMIGDFYEYRDQTEPAIKTYRRLIAELPADPSAEDAVWRLGWIAYKARRYGDAIKILGEDLQHRPSGPLGGQFGYWIGRSAEAMDQPLKAANAYREVCRGFLRSFYCQQATVQLARLARLNSQAAGDTEADRPADAPPEAALKKVNGTIIGLPTGGADASLMRDRHYAVSLELMALHLKPEAARELDALAERYATDKANVLKLAELLYAAGDYYHSLRLLKLYFLDVMEKGGDDIPKSFWEQAYPNHFLDLVKRQSPAATVDPYLVAAVAREESAFDPKAVSKVGALGLMQLMPYTGEWVARRVGLKPFSPDLLLDGAVNIRLGAWYLQHLVEQFNGNVVLAVASYNAGPEAVGRWAEKGAGNLDEFIESIPFNETRYFTKKVIRSYNEYRRIAGE
ncbi:MAG: transglycosylase SLT domain-containing protein, partial [Nitrospirae bacterium]|nr:transglycosylase SLT domain-containing protein [Nitrospirota bacterium]